MKFTKSLVLGCLALGACTTFEDVGANLDLFEGKSLDYAISNIGYPTGETHIAGHHLYIWENSSSGSFINQAPMTATTLVGGQYIQTTGSVPVAQNYTSECRVTMEVDSANIVSNVQWSGNMAGCERYANLNLEGPPTEQLEGLTLVEEGQAKGCKFLGDITGSSPFYGAFAKPAYASARKEAVGEAMHLGATHITLENGGSSSSNGTKVYGKAYKCRG